MKSNIKLILVAFAVTILTSSVAIFKLGISANEQAVVDFGHRGTRYLSEAVVSGESKGIEAAEEINHRGTRPEKSEVITTDESVETISSRGTR